MKFYLFRLFSLLYIIFALTLVFSSNVIASDIIKEDFSTSALNTDNWTVLNELNSSILNGNYLSILAVDEYKSVFVENKMPFETTNGITFEIKFRFNELWYGGGIALNDQNQPLRVINGDPSLANWTFFVWPVSNNSFKVFSSTCIENEPCLNADNPLYTISGIDSNDWHTIKVTYSNSKYTYKLDNLPEKISIATQRAPKYVWFGNPMIHGVAKTTSFDIDYLYISDLSTSPVFPYLSQLDPLWKDFEYDSAQNWAGLEKSGIGRWGCALTSTAMIMKNYGVKALDGSDINPDILNTWLKTQPDGYIGPGLLNWLAITRYARESFALNPTGSTKLEFQRSYLPTTPILPAILGVPGHFVVAHGEDATIWKINDPASIIKTELPKISTVNSVNRFIPSMTDLSYMMFTLSPGAIATLSGSAGENIPITWTEEYLDDDSDGTNSPKLQLAMVPKPTNGKYILRTNNGSNNSGELKVYLYDELGQTVPKIHNLIEPTNTFEINFDKDPTKIRNSELVDITPPPIPTVISPENNAHVNTIGLVLDWSDEIDLNMPVTYKYKSSWPGGSYGPVSTGTNSYINAPGTPDQTYLWQVQACDNIGNCSDWASSNLVVDSTAPSTDIVFPLPGPSSNYFEVVFSEPVIEIEATNSANYYLSNWPGAGGSGDLTGDATVTYNEASTTSRIIFTKPGWYISPEQLWGVQNIHDLAGNQMMVNPYEEYSTPMTPPSLPNPPSTTPNPTNQISQIWNWLAATDIGSGVKGYSTRTLDTRTSQYLTDWLWIGQVLGMTTSLGEGSWQLSLRATDNAGNNSVTQNSSTLVVDTTPPSIPTNLHFDNPAKACGGFTNNRLITFDWDDSTDNNAVMGYEYIVDYPLGESRGSWTTFFTNSSYRGSLNEGIHYIRLRAKDPASNYSSSSNSCAITYDSITPNLKDKTIFNGWYNSTQTSFFDFTDTNLASDYLAPSCEISSEGLSQSCTLTPNVCDKADNCYTATLTSNPANIDLTKPTVALDTWGTTITGTAFDVLSGLAKIELRITKPDNSEYSVSATGLTNWSYTMTESPLGHYNVIVVATDVAGNLSDELSKEFDLNPTSPALSSNDNQSDGSVAGAQTSVTDNEKPNLNNTLHRTQLVDKPEILAEPDEEIVEEELDSQTSDGTILGETTEIKKNYWWWLLLLIIPGLYIIARICRDK